MKSFPSLISTTFLLISAMLFGNLSVSGLWSTQQFSWPVPNKTGPSIIAKEGGNLLFYQAMEVCMN